MSRVLVIPDVHLKPVMFERAAKIMRSEQADYAVQMGDVLDDWDRMFDLALYERTLEAMLEFHKEFPETVWLLGNHDAGYVYPELGKHCSGHSYVAEDLVRDYFKKFHDAGLFHQVLHIVGNTIFSHAGLTNQFVIRLAQDGLTALDSDEVFAFVEYIHQRYLWNDDSPLWARPHDDAELMAYKPVEYFQVVGHTPVEEAKVVRRFLHTDTFSTYSNGAPIGEQKFVIVDTVNCDWWYANEPES